MVTADLDALDELAEYEAMFGDDFWQQERDELRAALLPLMVSVMLDGAQQGIEELGDHGLGVDPLSVSGQTVAYATQITDELLDIIATSNRDGTGQIIAAWIDAGEPLPALIRRLERAGIQNAELVGITEVTRAFSAGQRIAWDLSGFVTARIWKTVGDDAVCPICRPLDGRVVGLYDRFTEFDIDANGNYVPTTRTVGSLVNKAGIELNPFGDPPAHPRCRCILIPQVIGA